MRNQIKGPGFKKVFIKKINKCSECCAYYLDKDTKFVCNNNCGYSVHEKCLSKSKLTKIDGKKWRCC